VTGITRQRGPLIAVAAGLLGAACVACNLIVSTTGLSGGDVPVPGDADAGIEGGSGDGALPDASTDAATDATFCDRYPGATLCADFDRGDLELGWTKKVVSSGCTLTLGTEAISMPSALVASVPPSPGNVDPEARLLFELPAVPRIVHLELDAKLCATSLGNHEFGKLEISSSTHAVAVGYESNGLELGVVDGVLGVMVERYDIDGAVITERFPLPAILPDRWFHLSLDATLSTSNEGALRVVVDRAATPAIDKKNLATMGVSPISARLIVGTYASGVPTACTDRLDNVLLTTTP